MKSIKKLACLLLALTVVFAMAVTVSADDAAATSTITAPAGSTRTYEVYQIFTADLSEDDAGATVLSNVKWGKNGNGTAGEDVEAAVLEALAAVNSKSDAEKMTEIEKHVNLESEKFGEVKDGAPLTVPNGYYLIKDAGPVGEGEAYSKYVVKIVGDTTIAPKVENVSFEKKIKDTNDTTGVTTGWQDSADYDIGDAIPFQLKGTVAKDFAEYTNAYYFAFHDKAENSLTFSPGSVKVYVDGSQITDGYQLVTAPTDGCTFEVVFDNLKNVASVKAGSVIIVEYTAALNENAVLGKAGNMNQAKLGYSNNPYTDQHGETNWDNVIAFTYQVVVNKYANSVEVGNEKSGAEFTLEKVALDGTKTTIAVVKNTEGTTFTFKGLDDGDYILTETVTPAGFNTIDPITFTVTAEHDVQWTTQNRNEVLTSLSGNTDTGEITFTASEDKDTLSTNVVNMSGSTLPETGGIGTTVFYVLGGALVLAAVVLLVTKKRMHSAE